MVIVAGSIQVSALGRDEYLASCIEVVRLARIAPGCVDFAISPDLVDPSRVNVYEQWENEEDLEAFRSFGPLGEGSNQLVSAHVNEFRGSFG